MNTIDRFSAQNVSRTYVHNTDPRPERAHNHHQDAPKTDSVSLSDDARSLAAARQVVQAAPDLREQKVADIKQRVEDGTYSVASRVLARNILDSQVEAK
jgi:negative regulator of flagellin synthesis FlgM